MSERSTALAAPILVVGASGDLGRRVVRELATRGRRVRALVRGDHGEFPAEVETVRGDLLQPDSLGPALAGTETVVTTATGFSDWASPNPAVDDEGNRNLIDAAARAGVSRFVFTSVLSADTAEPVAPFWLKKLTEDHLEKRGLPFVILRPGTLIGGKRDFWKQDLARGRLTSMAKADVPITFVHVDDLAGYLADAADAPAAIGRRIDVGAAPAASYRELAAIFTRVMGKDVALRSMPWPAVNAAMKAVGVFKPSARHFWTLMTYLSSGVYVADTAAQAELFDRPVPSLHDTLERYASGAGLIADTALQRTAVSE
jgi:uncharacterized protein YbjT (DUF2867 family)